MPAEANDSRTASDKAVGLQGMVGRPVEHLDLYQVHAIEKERLPSNWRVFRWEAFPKSGRGDCIYIAVTGAVCEYQYLKGKRKGHTNWHKRDAKTEVTVNLPVADHNAWKLEWEKRTGKCSNCTGTGEVMESWNVNTGTKYRTCPKCKGARTPNDRLQRPADEH